MAGALAKPNSITNSHKNNRKAQDPQDTNDDDDEQQKSIEDSITTQLKNRMLASGEWIRYIHTYIHTHNLAHLLLAKHRLMGSVFACFRRKEKVAEGFDGQAARLGVGGKLALRSRRYEPRSTFYRPR